MATVLVTGATGGIGRAIVAVLCRRGDEVLAVGRSAERLAELGSAVRPVLLDLARPEAIEAALTVPARLDALIHNAGVLPIGRIAELRHQVWTETLAVNLASAAELTRLLLPALRTARGQVVFVNSGAGIRAAPEFAAYAASKHGLRALADALRVEEAPNGVRVGSLHPGSTDTRMQRLIHEHRGLPYDPAGSMRPRTVAQAVLTILDTPRDAHLTELRLRQAGE